MVAPPTPNAPPDLCLLSDSSIPRCFLIALNTHRESTFNYDRTPLIITRLRQTVQKLSR